MIVLKFRHFVDTHSHTIRSFDGMYRVEELLDSAIEKGIETVNITDHVEMDWFFGHPRKYSETAYNSYADVMKAKKEYEGKIEVLAGIELGEPCFNLKETEKLLYIHDYDMVIGSLHNLKNWDDFSQINYAEGGFDIYGMLREYYRSMTEMAEWGGFDTLAHIIYPMRYLVGKYGIHIDKSKIKNDVDELLKTLAEKELALEINTSGLRQTIGTTMPDVETIKRFKELGGKHVTVGSDSHTTKDMGAGVEQGFEIAKECGFDHVLIFRKRQPVEIPLELK